MNITVQKIWPLDPTKNSGGFKGTDGVNYYCEIGAYHLLREGMTFDANPRPYVAKSSGKTSYILPKDWHPPATVVGNGAAPPPPLSTYSTPEALGGPRQAASGAAPAFFPEIDRQGYIVVQCLMKILADAQTQAGKPVDTQDIPLLAQAAVQTWKEHIKGKV